MTSFVSLLRGINVGPNTTVKMDDLVVLYRTLGLENVRTYLRSGNVLFDAQDREPDTLAAAIEKSLALAVGFPVKVIIRTCEDLSRIAADNPFLQEQACDPGTLHVTFLSGLPPAGPDGETNRGQNDQDRFIIMGTEVYLCCPHGYGRTKFSNAFFEKRLALVATTRNWKTVTALAEMAKE